MVIKGNFFFHIFVNLSILGILSGCTEALVTVQALTSPKTTSFKTSTAPTQVPENFPYLANLSLQNSTGAAVYSFDSNTCVGLTLNTSSGILKGVLDHKETESCTFAVKALVNGTEEFISDLVTLNFISPLAISLSSITEIVKAGDPAKTVQIEFSPAPPYASYLPYDLLTFGDNDLNLLSGFSSKGEISVQVGLQNQNINLAMPNSVSLPTTEHQSLYITAGTSTARPQIDLALYQNTPLAITDISQSAVGGVCAITSAGTLNCWGGATDGEFGTGMASENFQRPERIDASTNWEVISMKSQNTCGIRSGELFCWGDNNFGQVGTGSISSNVLFPYKVDSSVTWTYVSSGNSTCGIKSGELYCWGNNSFGNIGNGTTGGNVLSLTKIGALTTWQKVEVGSSHTCGIADGNLYCWGSNSDGKVGTGDVTPSYNIPQLISSGSWTTVTTGQDNTCGIKAGTLYCWGDNSLGQSIHLATIPTQVGTGTTWTSVHNEHTITCGINNGDLYCWGFGSGFSVGQIGIVDAGPGWTKFKTTPFAKGCGIKNSQAKCYPGNNGSGYEVLGNGNASGILTTPLKLGNSSWNKVSRGQSVNCGIQSGGLYCWGKANSYGQLGNGTTTIRENYPRKVGPFNDWTHVSVEQNFAAGIRSGELYWWG